MVYVLKILYAVFTMCCSLQKVVEEEDVVV